MPCEKACWKDVNNIMVSRVEEHDGGGWEAYDYDWGSRPTGRGKTPLDALADLQAVLNLLNEQQRTAIQDAADELKALSRKAFRRLIRDHKPGWIAQWLEETSEQNEKGGA